MSSGGRKLEALEWAIKARFDAYVRSDAGDGVVRLAGGVVRLDSGAYSFPATARPGAEGSFGGSVAYSAYHDALHLEIVDPAVVEGVDGVLLTIADPDDSTGRAIMARLQRAGREEDGSERFGARLTDYGAAMFMFRYLPQEHLEPVVLRLAESQV